MFCLLRPQPEEVHAETNDTQLREGDLPSPQGSRLYHYLLRRGPLNGISAHWSDHPSAWAADVPKQRTPVWLLALEPSSALVIISLPNVER